jgi:hypothetical protein
MWQPTSGFAQVWVVELHTSELRKVGGKVFANASLSCTKFKLGSNTKRHRYKKISLPEIMLESSGAMQYMQ